MIFTSRALRTSALSLAAALTIGTLSAQTPAPKHHTSDQKDTTATITPEANEAPETQTWTTEQLIPLTVSEAWQMSGKNEDKFFDMVQDLAAFSAQKRGLVLPESAEAGRRAGMLIKQMAKADHNQLLYAVVDSAVRKVGTKAPTTTATK